MLSETTDGPGKMEKIFLRDLASNELTMEKGGRKVLFVKKSNRE